VTEHASQLRVGPMGAVLGFDQEALLRVAAARGFDLAVIAELLPAAEAGLLEGLRLRDPGEAREDPSRRAGSAG
jgi:hypothetical protein